ncbi:hypothetical protein [Escherichia coli]|uniref:hypothetical protein n=1 Tax=Escherichia coli TaxID=562 RepID=UPI0039793F26
MSIKHYDVVRAASPSDLAEKLTQTERGAGSRLEGDVTTPVLVKPSDGEGTVISAPETGVLLCCGSGGAVKQHGIW